MTVLVEYCGGSVPFIRVFDCGSAYHDQCKGFNCNYPSFLVIWKHPGSNEFT